MARPELSDDQWKKLSESLKQENEFSDDEIRKFKHYLKSYSEGDFNNHEIVIVSLQNKAGTKKYIESKQSQLSKRSQYYWINGIKEFLEEGLIQDRLVISEDYQELDLNGEQYFVNKKLL